MPRDIAYSLSFHPFCNHDSSLFFFLFSLFYKNTQRNDGIILLVIIIDRCHKRSLLKRKKEKKEKAIRSIRYVSKCDETGLDINIGKWIKRKRSSHLFQLQTDVVIVSPPCLAPPLQQLGPLGLFRT